MTKQFKARPAACDFTVRAQVDVSEQLTMTVDVADLVEVHAESSAHKPTALHIDAPRCGQRIRHNRKNTIRIDLDRSRYRQGVANGDPGIGKSFSFCDLAARISTGREFPDGAPCQLGEVLIFSSEDDPGDTLAPRLRAHEADLDRIHFLTVESSEGGFQQFDIINHLSQLNDSMKRQPDARLLVLDPLTAYMGDIDSNSNTDVRRVLGPLCEMAQKHQVAVLGVSHLTKKDTRAVARTLGSMAFVAASRANWIITRDKEDRHRSRSHGQENALLPDGS